MHRVAVLGIYAADLIFHAPRLPVIGETLLGERFSSGPGGKGSNQAVAAARAGGRVSFLSRIGDDEFARRAVALWDGEGIDVTGVSISRTAATGAAFIFVSTVDGNNAIVVAPGAAAEIAFAGIAASIERLGPGDVFLTQLESPAETGFAALAAAKARGATTILNPAPAYELPLAVYPSCDYLTPNESEAAALVGFPVDGAAAAARAADVLMARGVGSVLVTLGPAGAFLKTGASGAAPEGVLVPAFAAGTVVDTTGAGDAFNGGFAVALAEGRGAVAAARFAAATGSLSVTRPGAASSMPLRADIDALLATAVPIGAG